MNTFTSKNVFIAGYTGFLGKALKPDYKTMGNKFYLLNRRGLFKYEPEQDKEEMVSSNPYDRRSLLNALKDSNICINLAGRVGGYGNVSDPKTIQSEIIVNVLFTDYLSFLSAEANVRLYLWASTMAIYYQFASHSTNTVDERVQLDLPSQLADDIWKGINKFREIRGYNKAVEEIFAGKKALSSLFPENALNAFNSLRFLHAFSKLMGEQCVADWLPPKTRRILRISNIYTTDVKGTRIIPSFISRISRGENISVYDCSRNFLFEGDFRLLLLNVLNTFGQSCGEINIFAPDCTISLYKLAILMKRFFPASRSSISINHQVSERKIDFLTLYSYLYNFPSTPLRKGLEKVIKEGKL